LPGLSLRWYHDFLHVDVLAARHCGTASSSDLGTALATLLGTLGALGMWRTAFPGQRLISRSSLHRWSCRWSSSRSACYFAFAPLGLTEGYRGLILAHTTLAAPFVVVTVLATLSGFDRTLLRAPRASARVR
jgi:putative spermidine/putrescine transport system permease protein